MKLIFAGTPEIAAAAMRRISEHHEVVLAISMPDAPVGRKRELTPSAVSKAATELVIPLLKCSRLGESEIEKIAACGADLAIVIAYGAMIPAPALQQLPWLNIHFSLLPEFRGATPLQHSMIHDRAAGVSIFHLDIGLDTGPLVAQKPVEFLANETAGEALIRFTDIAVDLLLETLEKPLVESPQQGSPSSAPKFSRSDAKLDLNEAAHTLARKIRAFNPEPMAWVTYEKEPVRVLSGEPQETELPENQPGLGTIVKLEGGAIAVKTGAGSYLRLHQVQPAGKNPMPASQWWNGLKTGARIE